MVATDDETSHPYQSLVRRLGEYRPHILRILYERDEPVQIGTAFGQDGAGVPYGSREYHLLWLTRYDADDDEDPWWPDDLGGLVEVVSEGGRSEGREIQITDDGRAVVEYLRENDDEFYLTGERKSIRGTIRENTNRIEQVETRLDDLPEREQINELREYVLAIQQTLSDAGIEVQRPE